METLIECSARAGLPLIFPHTDGGMNLAGFLEGAAEDTNCAQRLQENGLDVPALSRYSLRPTRAGLIFGFTAFEPQAIRESIARAARVLERSTHARRH